VVINSIDVRKILALAADKAFRDLENDLITEIKVLEGAGVPGADCRKHAARRL